MTFVPKKPHFFKPVLPNFRHNGLSIPISFIERYLKGPKLEYVELRRGNRKWKLKIVKGRIMEEEEEEGLSKFWEENEVEVGDFLVFRHEGDFVFEVLLFDPSTLLKPILISPPNPPVKQEIILDHLHHNKPSPLPAKSVKQHKFDGSTNKIPKGKKPACKLGFEDKATNCSRNTDDDDDDDAHPYFSSTLAPFNLKKSMLRIPMEFARSNGLANRKCEMIMKDEKGRSWPLRLMHDRSHVYITGGYNHFCTTNGLKEGDSFIIQLLHNGYKPLMNFRRLNKIPMKKHEECKFCIEDKATTKCSRNSTNTTTTHHDDDGGGHGHPCFSSTLTATNINSSVLYIPVEFARSNDLTNRECEMIMKDERGRSWPLRLEDNGSHVCIRGFHHFLTANGLKEGVSFVIHLLQNGNNPLMNFHSIGESKIGKEGKEQIKREAKMLT